MAAASSSSFFSTVGNALKFTAKAVVTKTKAGIAHLKALPTQTTCKKCENIVMIPPESFNWECSTCGTSNHGNSEACSACGADCISPLPKVMVVCTMCSHENNVPRNNLKKHASNAVVTTKKVARKTSEAVKAEYARQRDIPDQFPCNNCQTMLVNPNKQQADQQPIECKEVQCPVCKSVVPIPGTHFEASVKKSAAVLKTGITRVYYGVAGKKYANCPVCSNPCKAEKPQQVEGVHDESKQKYDLQCEKCQAQFPIMM